MTQLYMKYRKRIKWLVLVYCFIMSINCLGQNKLNRNQILDVARTHLQNHNNAPAVDSVKCDSSTTKLTLEIIDNSISQSYMIIFTKKTIEIKVYNISQHLLNEGLIEINALMPLIGWHYENNQWEYPKEYYNGDGEEKL